MARILIAYGTVEGQTRKVAEHIAEAARRRGHEVHLADATVLPSSHVEENYDGVFVGASVHQGKHQATVMRFVEENAELLRRVPGAFFSVSLSAMFDDAEHEAEVRQYIEEFMKVTGWKPQQVLAVAGALRFSEYDFFKRLLMRMISKKILKDVDPSRDYEFTDWESVTQFAEEFLREFVEPPEPGVNTAENETAGEEAA